MGEEGSVYTKGLKHYPAFLKDDLDSLLPRTKAFMSLTRWTHNGTDGWMGSEMKQWRKGGGYSQEIWKDILKRMNTMAYLIFLSLRTMYLTDHFESSNSIQCLSHWRMICYDILQQYSCCCWLLFRILCYEILAFLKNKLNKLLEENTIGIKGNL